MRTEQDVTFLFTDTGESFQKTIEQILNEAEEAANGYDQSSALPASVP